MLPVTDAGEPDYQFMEQYIRDFMLKKYSQYMFFLHRKKQYLLQQLLNIDINNS